MDPLTLQLEALTREDAQQILPWRVRAYESGSLRTARRPSPESQARWSDALLAPGAPHLYFALVTTTVLGRTLVGMTGLTYLSWENGSAEIALLLNPNFTGAGHGREAVRMVLREAFGRLRLETVYGECYACSPALGFWERLCEESGARSTVLPQRKFWNGRLYDGFYFVWNKEGVREWLGDLEGWCNITAAP